MYSSDLRSSAPAVQTTPEGLYIIEAAFYTENFVVHGEIVSPDMRLSDHLNGSSHSLEIRPLEVESADAGADVNLPSSHAHLYKEHLLFILPIAEPKRAEGQQHSAWTRTKPHRCWAAVGRYTVQGNVHGEMGRDDRLFLRSLDHKQFIPMTAASITMPDGRVRTNDAVIVNRSAVEMLALVGG